MNPGFRCCMILPESPSLIMRSRTFSWPFRNRFFMIYRTWHNAQVGWYLSASWVESVWNLEDQFHSGPFGMILVDAGRFARSWQLFDSQQRRHHVRLNSLPQIKRKKNVAPLMETDHSPRQPITSEKSPSGLCPPLHLLMLLRPMLSSTGRGASLGSLKCWNWWGQNSFYQWYP